MSVSPIWTSFSVLLLISAIFCPLGTGAKDVRKNNSTPSVGVRNSTKLNGHLINKTRNGSTPSVKSLNSTESGDISNRYNTTNEPRSTGNESGSKMSAGAVAGVVIVALVIVVAATVGSFCVFKWRKKKPPKKDITLPPANMPSRFSKDIDSDIPSEPAPPPPKNQHSMSNRPQRPPPLSQRAKVHSSLEPENVYESYDEKNSPNRPMSYEVPMAKMISGKKGDDAAPRRPPRPKRDKNRFVEVSLEESVESTTSDTYDDVSDDAYDRDSYEYPITRSEDHTYRAMFESSVKSDDYYTDVKDD